MGYRSSPSIDHQLLKKMKSLATKVNRVQRWVERIRAYTYKSEYRAGRANRSADLMSRLPLRATPADSEPYLSLSDPVDVDVYFIGASGVRPANIRETPGSILGGLPEA